ncbi:MAG: SpoIID/LytB domain-containing protein [Jaaginema sp. PMC 1079.18]|nr:SpoIID/LytB domain-containing protein [Jaaginema sp. PMC 1080.18]MEC4854013.1 SpoIID/LytB domain-containing protein [Jaaginema sp. PMC 1079.18]MEC4867266.1 SpoIID/LytB domain-containing protein [Jaaginema sp. PMC 1078.18]
MRFKPSSLFFLLSFSLITTLSPTAQAQDVDIKVGVVQRFGDEPTETLTLASNSGDTLTLEFLGGDLQPKTLSTDKVTLEINPRPVETPIIQERVVLSDRATFETAEASAKAWRAKGIAVEIVQPGRWQVWAKRDVYKTPVLRRLLLESLREQGETTPYLESEVLEAVAKVSFVVDGFRYNRDRVSITSGQNRIQVQESNDEETAKTHTYAGDLNIQPNAYGDFTLVNTVPLETYLRGVVPHEIGPNAPYQAVAAQAILARTYALRNLRRFRADDYQLCASVHCQVYHGLTATVEKADRAIIETQGQVLTYNNELIDALYSSTTGGITAQFSDIWDGENRPYLQPRVDSPNPPWNLAQQPLNDEATFRRFIALTDGFNESGINVFRWDRQSSIEALTADLNRYLERTKNPITNITRITNMAVTERSPSGRILTLSVYTDKGTIALHKTEARSAFEPPRSTLFYLEPIQDANQSLTGYRFIGGGFGHGVGMSQYGSYNLANLGKTAPEILAFYYPQTTLTTLNPNIVYYSEDGFGQ